MGRIIVTTKKGQRRAHNVNNHHSWRVPVVRAALHTCPPGSRGMTCSEQMGGERFVQDQLLTCLCTDRSHCASEGSLAAAEK